MIQRKTIFLAITFLLNLHCVVQGGDIITISLGKDCEPAWRLKQFNLRKAAFPFDWLRTLEFHGVNKIIEERFSNFLIPNYLNSITLGVMNTYYSIEFVHDFPTSHAGFIPHENENDGVIVSNYLDYLSRIKDKYEPRIKRFFDALNGSSSVIFFRTNINPEQAQEFVNIINTNHPNLQYTLAVVHGNQALNYDWNIPHVVNFYAQAKDYSNNNNWFHEQEWAEVFKKLKLISSTTRSNPELRNWHSMIPQED